jgi:phosphoserine phosphatase
VFCYLIRHGEIQSNVNKVYSGRSAEPLTPHGKDQARNLADQLTGKGIRMLYASPLTRALQTAEILNRQLQVPCALENDLMEIELGPLEGLSYEQAACRYPEAWKVWNEKPGELRLEGMETIASVQQRIIALLERWHALHAEVTIAAVSHLAVIRCVRLFTEQRSLNDYKKITIPNATALLLQASRSSADGSLQLRVIEEVT